jgi:type IV pilus assembly protein PilW
MSTSILNTSRRKTSGFTLVELMVTLAIGMFLTLGLVQVFATSNESYEALSQAAQQIENGRHAVETLRGDLQHAGYYGEYGFAPAAAAPLPNPCELANLAVIRDALPFYIQGYDAPAVSPLACLDSANVVPGTDVLVIRRASTVVTAPAARVVNELYMQAIADSNNAANPVIARGQDAGLFSLLRKDAVTPAEVRKYMVRIYFVSPCSVPAAGNVCSAAADAGRPIPTLKRLDLAANPATGNLEMRMESIAEGIESLQIDYGIDATGDGVPDGALVTVPATVAAWSNVATAQLHVLARNVRATPGHVDAKTYDLGVGGTVTPGGNFRRHVFSAQVRLVNPAGRREEP